MVPSMSNSYCPQHGTFNVHDKETCCCADCCFDRWACAPDASSAESNVQRNALRMEQRRAAHQLLNQAMDMTEEGESWLPNLVKLVLKGFV